jgi:hypothetical protein
MRPKKKSKKNDIENENNDDDVSDFEDDEEEPLPDDLEESDDDDDDETENIPDDDETEGDKMLRFWKARSRKLRHEMAISAWMCSPVAKIMEDAKENHNGDERDAVTILLKQWFCQEVNLFDCCLLVVYFVLF